MDDIVRLINVLDSYRASLDATLPPKARRDPHRYPGRGRGLSRVHSKRTIRKRRSAIVMSEWVTDRRFLTLIAVDPSRS